MRHTISKAVSLPAIDLTTRVERSLRNELSILEEDWHNSSQQLAVSASTSLLDLCRCCGQQFCENLDHYNRIIRKLESDTRLAAEIGQGLLYKHETFVTESNQQRAQLEKQVNEYHAKIIELEQSIDEFENDKDQLLNEKNKWLWEYQKRQKILDETVSDLQMANEKCKQLSMELKSKSDELEKLRLFKFMVRHSESREEMLTSKLEDTNQELALCRRHELVLESKIKKLKMRYETLHDTHEQLTRHLSTNTHPPIPRLHDTDKHASLDHNSTDDLIQLVKDLSLSNAKLKSELLSCKDQLLETKEQVVVLDHQVLSSKTKIKRATSFKHKKASGHQKKDSLEPVPVRSEAFLPVPVPTLSSSLPTTSATLTDASAVVHHHYHYYLKKNQGINNNDTSSSSSSHSSSTQTDTNQENNNNTKSSLIHCSLQTKQNKTTPFALLRDHVAHLLDRLRSSDIRALNRHLKRAFDIQELSTMSNAMIEDILAETDALDTHFLCYDTTGDFFPLVSLLKTILKELGLLKSTMNELQVAYVQKIQESEHRVQEEVLNRHKKMDRPLAWFTHLFFITRKPVGRHNSYDGSTLMDEPTMEDRIRPAFPRPIPEIKRKPKSHTPHSVPSSSTTMPHPLMHPSSSTGTTTRHHLVRHKRMSRVHIDYEGIGPAAIRPIPSDRDLSSSWLGGK